MLGTEDYTNIGEGDRVFEFEENGKKRVFIYDPDKMNFAQIADANTKLGLYDKMLEVLPNTPNEFQEAMKKEALQKGLAALLIEVNPENMLPLKGDYNPNTHTGLELMQKMKGIKDYRRLEVKCRYNFFIMQGRISAELTKQYKNIIDELEREMKNAGLSREAQETIYTALMTNNTEALESIQNIFMPETTSKKNIKKKQVRK
jgi:hypothetical protein